MAQELSTGETWMRRLWDKTKARTGHANSLEALVPKQSSGKVPGGYMWVHVGPILLNSVLSTHQSPMFAVRRVYIITCY